MTSPAPPTMTSILSSVSHHIAAMANKEIQPGSEFPVKAAVKEDDPEKTFHITGLTGRNVFVWFLRLCGSKTSFTASRRLACPVRSLEHAVPTSPAISAHTGSSKKRGSRTSGLLPSTMFLCSSASLAVSPKEGLQRRSYRVWKSQMAPDGTEVRFIADDRAELTLALGMLFDASPLLGGPRSMVCQSTVSLACVAHRFWGSGT